MSTPYLIEQYLRSVVEHGGSDLHIKANSAPRVRLKGALTPLNVAPLTPDQAEQMILETMDSDTKTKFLTHNEADYAIFVPEIGRFRANAFRAQGNVGLIARLVAGTPLTLEELHLPDVIGRLALEPRGMVLVTGPTGSGKQLLLSTPVPTPTGFTTMGELREGDAVFGRDGRVCRVTGLSPVDYTPDLYRMTFSDGQTIIADRDHQWLVATHHGRNVPRTRKRLRAIARHEKALADAEALEALALQPGLPVDVTPAELHNLIAERNLASEFTNGATVAAALKMVDCPFFEGSRARYVSYEVDRKQPAAIYETREYLEIAATTHRTRMGRATAAAVLAAGGYPTESTAQQLADLLGTAQASVRSFAATHGITAREGFAEWTETRSEERVMPVHLYPTDVALKSLALRLRQRFSTPPSKAADLTRMTVGEMLGTGLRLGTGHARFAIPVSDALRPEAANLPLDPYVLGAWLGDGTATDGRFTQSDRLDADAESDMEHLIREIISAGYEAHRLPNSSEITVGTTGVMRRLREVGVLNNKHVPILYLRASYEQRLALLQGLMDTDGSIAVDGTCELSLSDRNLATGALALIRTLGIKATVSWDQPVTYVDASGEVVEAMDRHRIHFTTTTPVFRLPRKKARLKTSVRETQKWVYITDIQPMGPEDPEYGPARCISVDSEDHTYLCGEGYLVTSNTTTLGAMVDSINKNRAVHILTIEDPVEIMHTDQMASVNQREVRTDTADFKVALKAAMRQDPDVILIGEMRDQETVHAAVSAAETGHFVMSTLHTTDAAETVNRIIDFFPPNEQKQIRVALAQSLKGIICQRLVPTVDGKGRVCVMEILVNTARIADAIMDPEKTHEIVDLVAEGDFYGMQTFDQHLIQLVLQGTITIDAAKAASSKPDDLAVNLKRAGVDPALVDA